jgi:hypothetical protein
MRGPAKLAVSFQLLLWKKWSDHRNILIKMNVFFCRVWVHSVIPADHEAEALLPHFVNYYHQLGISYKRFLFIVHHDPSRHDQAGLAQVTGICQGYSIECEVWQGNADPNTRLEKQLQMLKNFVDDPIDWIIVAEIDELQEWKVSLR